jgi:hypothetical protein
MGDPQLIFLAIHQNYGSGRIKEQKLSFYLGFRVFFINKLNISVISSCYQNFAFIFVYLTFGLIPQIIFYAFFY